MTIDTLRLTAEGARDLLKAGEISGSELFAAYRAAIEERDGELNAYLTLADDPGGDGIPIALKDVISTKGVRTTAGSKILENYVPVFDSTVAAHCKEHGFRVLGKTNTDEFAMGSSTENSAYGPSRNPWDPSRVPGGSGGGSAAAVSGGLAPWALGSDTGGSVKLPSAFCGNVGLRPTYGTVSRYGIVAFASSLDQVGPVAKTVRDCAYLYSVISGRDRNDSTTVAVPDVEVPSGEDLKGLRIGVPREYRMDGMPDDIERLWQRGLEWLRDAGAEIVDVSLPHTKYGLTTYYIVAPAEASSNLARYDGVRFGLRENGADLRDLYERTRASGFGAEVRRRVLIGTYVLSAGYYDAYYLRAQKVRALILRDFTDVFAHVDALVTPTAPSAAFAQGENMDDPIKMYLNDVFTVPANMAGVPGISVPGGLDANGLPLGLQVIGKPFDEATVFAVGAALERAAEFDALPAIRAGA